MKHEIKLLNQIEATDQVILFFEQQVMMLDDCYKITTKDIPTMFKKVIRGLFLPSLSKEVIIKPRSQTKIKVYSCLVQESFKNQIESTTDFRFVEIRELMSRLDEDCLNEVHYALQVTSWNDRVRFCQTCGQQLNSNIEEFGKLCTSCGARYYPSIFPAIIVAIRKEGKILLAKNKRFKRPFFSLIAGYVEAGETLEQCVEREVAEECGLVIKNIRYVMSQPWGYSSSLMIGFEADYESGEIALLDNELEEANWYDKDHLPALPASYSLAGKLIKRYVENTNS